MESGFKLLNIIQWQLSPMADLFISVIRKFAYSAIHFYHYDWKHHGGYRTYCSCVLCNVHKAAKGEKKVLNGCKKNLLKSTLLYRTPNIQEKIKSSKTHTNQWNPIWLSRSVQSTWSLYFLPYAHQYEITS